MAMTSEFVAAINQISAERGIEKEEIFKALESAILVAYKKKNTLTIHSLKKSRKNLEIIFP